METEVGVSNLSGFESWTEITFVVAVVVSIRCTSLVLYLVNDSSLKSIDCLCFFRKEDPGQRTTPCCRSMDDGLFRRLRISEKCKVAEWAESWLGVAFYAYFYRILYIRVRAHDGLYPKPMFIQYYIRVVISCSRTGCLAFVQSSSWVAGPLHNSAEVI
jgi:hypothetical protein